MLYFSLQLSSQGPTHDEIDFEFLGNLSGDPYTLHTNVFAQGKGNREMQFQLWFDPTKDFHTYSILWNPKHIMWVLKFYINKQSCTIYLQNQNLAFSRTFEINDAHLGFFYPFSFMVDGTPIRDFKNMESRGVAFPKNQPMRIYSSLWNADDWATQGGRIKTDWTKAPFTASYRNFNADACVWSSSTSNCPSRKSNSADWWNQDLDSTSQERMRWVQKNYMIYNYCTDQKRFPQGLPPECSIAWGGWNHVTGRQILLFINSSMGYYS